MGKIDFFLLKPFGFLAEIFWTHIGGKLLYLVLALPFLAALIYLLSQYFPVSMINAPLAVWLVFGALLLFGFLVEYLLGLIIVLLGFWFEGSEGLEHFKWISISLFSGAMIPIALLPEWLQSASYALPLQYMYGVPINILLDGAVSSDISLLPPVFFICFLILLVTLLWRKAVHTYASSGG